MDSQVSLIKGSKDQDGDFSSLALSKISQEGKEIHGLQQKRIDDSDMDSSRQPLYDVQDIDKSEKSRKIGDTRM